MKPLGDRIILKQVEAIEKTKGGIILPDSAKEYPLEGIVHFVGPKTQGISVGDKVMYGKYAHQPFSVDGEDWIVINEADVIAVVTE